MSPAPKVAACVLAYQSAETIGEMMASLVGHVDHVVILLDEKTTDETGERAMLYDRETRLALRGGGQPPQPEDLRDGELIDLEEYPEVIVEPSGDHQKMGFHVARNRAFDRGQAIPGVNWLFWIDTDDVFGADVPLRSYLAGLGPEASHVFLQYLYHRNAQGDVTTRFDRERLFRVECGTRWKFRIHEVCEVLQPRLGVRTEQLWIDHKNAERLHPDGRGERNFRLLREALAEDPGDVRAMRYLGDQHFAALQWTEAAEWWEKALNTPGELAPIERWNMLLWIARARRHEGDVPASIKAADLALQGNPQYPDAYYELAHSYAIRKQWRKAIEFHEMGLAKTERPPNILVTSDHDYSSNPHLVAHTAYYQVGEFAKAIDAVTKGLEWNQGDPFLIARGKYYVAAWNRTKAILSGLALAQHLLDTNEPLKARKVLTMLPAGAIEDRPEIEEHRRRIESALDHLRGAEAYENFYFAEQQETIKPTAGEIEHVATNYPRMEWVLRRMLAARKDPTRAWKVLDVGVGNAISSLYYAKHGFSVVGVDIDQRRVKDGNFAAAEHGYLQWQEVPQHTTPATPTHVHGACQTHLVDCKPDCATEHACERTEHPHIEWQAECELCGPPLRIPVMDPKAQVQFHWVPADAEFPDRIKALGPYDFVVAGEVIEHVEDPDRFLRTLEGLNATRVILTTPDGAWKGHQERNPGHVQAWSRLEFETMISPRGVIISSQGIDPPRDGQPSLGMEYLPGDEAKVQFMERPPVHIYCGEGLERWSPDQVDGSGLGGSETAVVYVARELAADLRLRVTVFGPVEGVWDGVRYRHYSKFRMADPRWVLILWRHPEMAEQPSGANFTWVWAHDLDYGGRVSRETMRRVDTYAVVSEFHARHTLEKYPFLANPKCDTEEHWHDAACRCDRVDHRHAAPSSEDARDGCFRVQIGENFEMSCGLVEHTHETDSDRVGCGCEKMGHEHSARCYTEIVVVGNGIDPTRFEGKEERVRTRIAYASSPDRGLEQALTYWPRIREIEPEAELHIFYGWENYDLMGAPQEFKRRIKKAAAQPGVVWRGRLGQRALARELMKCSVLFYPGPHPFEETFGITFVEAQAAGCVPVTRNNGALPETNKMGSIVGNDASPEQWVSALVDALGTSKRRRAAMSEWARGATWRRVADTMVKRALALTQREHEREVAAEERRKPSTPVPA